MPHDVARQASALIEHIQLQYHEGHRRDLPELVSLAAAVEARGIADDLVNAVRLLGDALEQHMFKEEMRLFPMMEQGGNTLIDKLIEDLHREHLEHDDAMLRLRVRLGGLKSRHGADPALERLIRTMDRLATELQRHIDAEDHDLFPLFLRPASIARPDRPDAPSSSRHPRAHHMTTTTDPRDTPALIEHILERYHAVHRQQLPALLQMAAKVEDAHRAHADLPRGLTTLLTTMHSELLQHMEKEETILFPMLAQGGNPFVVHPIGVMRAEHDEHAERLAQLLALTRNGTPPADACATWRQLSEAIRQFADDLQRHIDLENEVLFPRFEATRV